MFDHPATDTNIICREVRILIRRMPEIATKTNARTGAMYLIPALSDCARALYADDRMVRRTTAQRRSVLVS